MDKGKKNRGNNKSAGSIPHNGAQRGKSNYFMFRSVNPGCEHFSSCESDLSRVTCMLPVKNFRLGVSTLCFGPSIFFLARLAGKMCGIDLSQFFLLGQACDVCKEG